MVHFHLLRTVCPDGVSGLLGSLYFYSQSTWVPDVRTPKQELPVHVSLNSRAPLGKVKHRPPSQSRCRFQFIRCNVQSSPCVTISGGRKDLLLSSMKCPSEPACGPRVASGGKSESELNWCHFKLLSQARREPKPQGMEPPSSASFPPKEHLSGRPTSETQWAGFAASKLRGITRSRNEVMLLFLVDVVVLPRLKAQSITFHSHFLEIISHLLPKVNVRSVT